MLNSLNVRDARARAAWTLNLIREGGWPALAVALGLAVFTHLAIGARLVVATGRPVAVLVVATLVVAAGLLLHGVRRVPLARGMPARLLKHKPNVACPEDKVQEAKDLAEEKRSSSPGSRGLTAQPDLMDPEGSWESQSGSQPILLPKPAGKFSQLWSKFPNSPPLAHKVFAFLSVSKKSWGFRPK